jgi:hypothetical protein
MVRVLRSAKTIQPAGEIGLTGRCATLAQFAEPAEETLSTRPAQ